jgi:hypothetical protein
MDPGSCRSDSGPLRSGLGGPLLSPRYILQVRGGAFIAKGPRAGQGLPKERPAQGRPCRLSTQRPDLLMVPRKRDNCPVTADPDSDGEDERNSGDDSEGEEHGESRRSSFDPDVVRNVEAFRSLQRQIAGFNLSAVRAAQRAVESALSSVNIAAIVAAQDTIARNIARSLDFSGLQAAGKALAAAANLTAASEAQQRWAQTIAASIDVSALRRANEALVSNAALAAVRQAQESWAEAVARQVDFTALADRLTIALPKIEIGRWLEILQRWIPANLREIGSLDAVAQVSLDEGLPLSWVPRQEIVEALLAAKGADERSAILDDRLADILDDCEAALADSKHEWARQCRAAISALRAGHDGPAQSHGANIIDSIVLRLMGRNGRMYAKKRAEEGLDDLPLQLVAESLTLRPLFRAFTTWWPTSGDAPPDHFARHATAHAIGYEGLFERRHAVVAVMLATSLTVQFSDELAESPDASA